MNIIVKSIQKYEDHEEEIIEEYENSFWTKEDSLLTIETNTMKVEINSEKNTVWIQRDQNEIFIQLNEKKLLSFETEYGTMKMGILGESISVQENPLKVLIEYSISLNEQTSYQNIVEITEK